MTQRKENVVDMYLELVVNLINFKVNNLKVNCKRGVEYARYFYWKRKGTSKERKTRVI